MESTDANTTPTNEPKPRNIVCVYSQADESFYFQLKKSLNLWERQGQVCWLEVLPGSEPATTWQHDVQHADLILFLLSSDFFGDDLCYHTMHLALQERTSRQVPVVPILVRAVNWRLSDCKDLAVVPRNEQPVASWPLSDEAYASIGADLVRLVPGWPPRLMLTRPRLFQARDLPKGYVPRPKAFEEIKHLLLNQQGNQTTAITTALRGAGGFGKTTLAIALCHDAEIQAAFPDGIIWVELGEQPPRPLDVLNGMLHALEPSLYGAITLEEARNRWHTALSGCMCLLVIDDVWQAAALEPLLEGGPHCVRLITTRNDRVLPTEARRVWVDAMEPSEAISLLYQRFPEEMLTYQPALEALVRRLGYWPLLLTLAHGLLVVQVRHKRTLVQALQLLEQAYEARGVLAFDPGDATDRQRAVKACIEVSLHHLEKWSPAHYLAVHRYQELVVFPEDTDIPLATLQLYWQETARLAAWEVEGLCMDLHDLSLLLICDVQTNTIRLHDVMRNYLEQLAGPALPGLQARFLSLYQQGLGIERWSEIPRSEEYLWQHLIWHLGRSGQSEVLMKTLFDPWYLIHKAMYVGVAAMEADLLPTITQKEVETYEVALWARLHRTIVRISHLLHQAQNEGEMGTLLLTHLGGHSAFASQQRLLEQTLPRPFLVAWHVLPGGSSTLSRTLRGHSSSVLGCAISGDGHVAVSAADDRTLKVWHTDTGIEQFTLSGHSGSILGCAISGDGHLIVSASEDKTLKVWDATTGTERFTLSGHLRPINGCAISEDGRIIVSASADKTLKVWDAVTGAERFTLSGHSRPVRACAISGDGSTIVSASNDRTLRVWDGVTGAMQFTLSGHERAVLGCAISRNGDFVISASEDKTLKLWKATTGGKGATYSRHSNYVTACSLSRDGRMFVSASQDHTLKVWETMTGIERLTLAGHSGFVQGCAMSDNGLTIVSASSDKTLKIWDMTMAGVFVSSARLSEEGSMIVSIYGNNDKENKERFKQPETDTGASIYNQPVKTCVMSEDGRLLVSVANDAIKGWDTATGAELFTIPEYRNTYINGCAVSADGSTVVLHLGSSLMVWDVATQAKRFSFPNNNNPLLSRGCTLSRDGRLIVAVSDDKTLKVWDAATGTQRFTLSGHNDGVTDCMVSEDGYVIISASKDGMLKLWNTRTGALLFTLSGSAHGAKSCAMSGDGRLIVATGQKTTLEMWKATTGAKRFTLSGHTAGVNGCAVSRDGRMIISASSDKTLKVWDATSGGCVLTFPVDGALYGCTFHSDGEHFVAWGVQGLYFLRLVMEQAPKRVHL